MVFKRSPTQRDARQGSEATGPAGEDWTDAEAALSKLARVAADQKPPAQGSDFSAGPRMAAPSLDPAIRPADPGPPATDRPPFRRRASRSLARFLVPACMGVAATLVWQSYGGMANQVTTSSDPQRIPVLPEPVISSPAGRGINIEEPSPPDVSALASRAASAQAAAAGASSPDMAGLAAPSVAPRELQQLDTILRDLTALRQSVEQLAAGQEQMVREIARLQAAGQDLRRRIPPAPPVTAAPKPAPPVPRAAAALPPPAPLPPPPSAAPLPTVPPADAPPRPPLPLR
jgi:hypothetical protein